MLTRKVPKYKLPEPRGVAEQKIRTDFKMLIEQKVSFDKS